MSAGVSVERWREAQRAEQSYWDEPPSDGAEFARTLAEKVYAAAWAEQRPPAVPAAGDWLEIGIGPLGAGCIQFLRAAAGRTLVGVEPLPLLQPDALRLPASLAATVAACRSAGYQHRCAKGEQTGLEAGRFGLAVCYNVLDHVHNPTGILEEMARALRPGGLMLLGCDTVSVASLVRFRAYIKRRFPDSIGVRAHPFRFRTRELMAMVERAGFRVLDDNRRQPEWLHAATGHAHRRLLLCEKQGAARDAAR
jgi:SAM-dependent methyltransferase